LTVNETLSTVVADVPVLVRTSWSVPDEVEQVAANVPTVLPPGRFTTEALTCAELVNVPKRPKTKPATAMAAMSVIAMRMTVARTGEMAFLFFPCCTIFIVEPSFSSFSY
jgi:hypothetical protein